MAVNQYDIEIPKMDYQIIEIAIKENGKLTKLDDDDKIYFTVKKSLSDKEPIFQKKLGEGINYNQESQKYEIEISSNDTKNCLMSSMLGLYGYDITIYYGGNKPKQKAIGNFKIGNKYTLNEVV